MTQDLISLCLVFGPHQKQDGRLAAILHFFQKNFVRSMQVKPLDGFSPNFRHLCENSKSGTVLFLAMIGIKMAVWRPFFENRSHFTDANFLTVADRAKRTKIWDHLGLFWVIGNI